MQRTNRHAVDDIELESMTELVEECKSKDKKRCEECEVLKLELAIMVGNCR